MQSLALMYRPRTFDDLVGQRQVQAILRPMIAKDAVPPALLFEGSRGTGKTTTARIVAAAVNCESPPGPCGSCVSCKSVYDGSSLDVIEIDAASNGLVDDIRALREHVMYGVGGNYRVVALDEAQSISPAGFNALLKILEEPPPRTVFILLTTEPRRIPSTITSRCIKFSFRRIASADIVERLAAICDAERLDVEPGLLTVIADAADGGLRDAVMLLDQVTRVGVTTVDAYTNLMGEPDYAPAVLRAAAIGDVATTFAALDDVRTRIGDPAAISAALSDVLRDVLVLQGGGALTKQGAVLQARQDLADLLDVPTTVTAMQVLWDLSLKVRPSDDTRVNLELGIVMLMQVFGKLPQQAPAAPTAPRKLTLAEMAARR